MENRFKEAEIITNDHQQTKTSWIPFFRQLSVAVGLWTMYFVAGVMIGSPTVVIPQLRQELNSSTTKFNEDFAPWISSVFGIGGVPWVIILPVLLERIGRKFTYMVISIVTLTGYIVFYTSNSAIQIVISEIIMGILVTSTQTVMAVIFSEYTAPRYRGLFLTFKSASFLWGIWIANAIGTFLHWKNIGIAAFVCCSYTITVALWPESPYWLASKGRFEECATAHRWLKGTDISSEQELAALIESQRREQNFVTKVKMLKTFKKMIVLPEIYKPTLICMLLIAQYYVSGKLVCSMYAIEIIKRITDNESTAYKTMLILDGVTVASAYIGSLSSKFLKRRTLMISTSLVANLFILILSLYLYLVKLSVLIENETVSISLLTIYSIAISSGALILMSSMIGEMLPLKYKSWCIFIIALFINIIHFATFRTAPEIFSAFGIHGAFLFYGTGSSIALFLVYKYLPETKDKTLQEIEKCFMNPTSFTKESAQEFLKSVDVENQDK